MARLFYVFFFVCAAFLASAFPSLRRGLGRSGGHQRCYRHHPGESNGNPAPPIGSSGSDVRQLMRLSLLGVSLLAGGRSSRAAPSSLCSTVSLEEIIRPSASAADSIVVTKIRDDRKFKAITLKNKLRVLLVSDPASSRSAAAMDVHVGSFSDPEDIPGLAHFCEHMSFLGTKSYPNEEDFTAFLSTHGGSSNAYTDSEDTVYFFDVNAEHLDGALDRFSQFFISPLFTETATNRELNAIDSEHAKNINNDGFRIYQLEKQGSNPKHPFHKFSTGNKQTLEADPQAKGINVREALLEFHAKHYSANQMTLCIAGKQPLQELERWAERYFSSIPNNNAPAPEEEWRGQIEVFPLQKAASLQEVVPVSESRRISLMWPIPFQTKDEKAALLTIKPESVVAHLIGHEGKGSLRSYLAEKNWASGVGASPSTDLADAQLFEVGIELTDEGFKHRDDVVEAVFAYLSLLTKPGPASVPPYIFQEVQQMSNMSFNNAEKSDPSELASALASDMQQFHLPREYLTGSRIFKYFPGVSECAVESYARQLTPQNLRVKVISKDFQGRTRETGPWYGTQYNTYQGLEKETKRWAAATYGKIPSLRLPSPNLLIPTNFDLVASASASASPKDRERDLSVPPLEIRKDGEFEVWYKLDKTFLQPRVYFVVSLAVEAQLYDEAFVMSSRLFTACFLESVNELLYEGRLAGLSFDLEFTSRGVELSFAGYSDKIGSFAERVLAELTSFRPNAAAFSRIKDQQTRALASWRTQQPYQHCSYYAALALETLSFSVSSLQAALEGLKVDSIEKFLPRTLRQSFGTALVAGNIDEKGALGLVSMVQTALPFSPIPASKRSRRHICVLPAATADQRGVVLRHPEPNDDDDNSATNFYFQLPSRAVSDTVPLEVLAEALEQGFYNELRTQQQLGYIVFSGLRAREGLYTLTLTVQSNVLDAASITERVETYLAQALTELTTMPADSFEAFKEGIRVRKLEPDQRLTGLATRLWSEIVLSDIEKPLFDRYKREVDELDRLDQKQFNAFVESILAPDGSRRRLLVSEITSKQQAKQGADAAAPSSATGLVLVKDEEQFRRSLPQM